nr:hypothetical protein [Mediterraneibacter glycyrrhizinilyticus]
MGKSFAALEKKGEKHLRVITERKRSTDYSQDRTLEKDGGMGES